MRILFLSPIFPFPVNSGVRQRMLITLQVLAEIGDVTLYSMCDHTPGADDRAAHICQEIHTIQRVPDRAQQRSLAFRIYRALHKVFDSRPIYTRWLDFPEWHARFQSLHPETYDLIWVQTLGLYEMLRPYAFRNVAVDLDGADSFKVRRELREKRIVNPRIALEWLDYAKLLRAETASRLPCHRFVACSERDRDHFSRSGKRVWLVRNAVSIPSVHTDRIGEDATLLYVGTLGYQPNRLAVTYFVRDILPRITRSYPQARFQIVGSAPSPDVLQLARNPHVTVSADVPSVECYLRDASVVVVPLLNGSGTRLKILEAMSFAKPVVSTAVGAEGLNLEHKKHVLIANSPDDFAACCLQLLTSRSKRLKLGEAGRRFVAGNHSIEAAKRDLYQFVEQAFAISTCPGGVVTAASA